MKVFKLFFKIFKKYQNMIIMYVGIMFSVVFGAIIPNSINNTSTSFKDVKVEYAICDEEKSSLSKDLGKYLETIGTKVEVKSFDKDVLQDELYDRTIRSAIIIKEGFADALKKGKASDYVTIYDIPDNTACMFFKQNVNEYLSYVDTYMAAGMSEAEAASKANSVTKENVEASLYKKQVNDDQLKVYCIFLYIPWVFTVMILTSLTPVLNRLSGSDIKRRIECSAYKFTRTNLEIVLGMIVVGVAICALFVVVSAIMTSGSVFSFGGLYFVNMFCMMLVCLSLTFMLSRIIKNDMVISLVGNVISLAFAFLSGVFVPMELLGKTATSIGRFLPSYWYVDALRKIENISTSSTFDIVKDFGVQVLFAVAICLVGIVISSRKRSAV